MLHITGLVVQIGAKGRFCDLLNVAFYLDRQLLKFIYPPIITTNPVGQILRLLGVSRFWDEECKRASYSEYNTL